MVFPADVPSLLVDNLDRYPPEPKDEEDQTREHGREEAFHNSYRWNGLIEGVSPFLCRASNGELTKKTDKTESSKK